MKRHQGPVVLVGHGYGGTVITQAGDRSNVAALVYMAACAPDIGESTTEVENHGPLSPVISRVDVDTGGFLYLPLAVVRKFLAHDLSARDRHADPVVADLDREDARKQVREPADRFVARGDPRNNGEREARWSLESAVREEETVRSEGISD